MRKTVVPTADVRVPSAVDGLSVWSSHDLTSNSSWLHHLSSVDIAELRSIAEELDTPDLDLRLVDKSIATLPGLSRTLADLHERIANGIGVVQIRGLPIDQIGRRHAAIIFWCISQHIGDQVVSQNAQGHLLGHVRDLGQSFSQPNSRGPYTSERIEFHTDACDIVGLLCLCPAMSGGESSLASAGLVFNQMQARRPDLVKALLKPVYRDRRGEIPPGAEPWYAFPVFNFVGRLLSVNNEPSYIDSVTRFFDDDPNTQAQHEALQFLETIAHDHHVDIPFEAGDMQFVNNHTILHSRNAFVDTQDPMKKRHLLRIWLLDYDGWPVPKDYYLRHGDVSSQRRPGGITGHNTTLHAPLDDV